MIFEKKKIIVIISFLLFVKVPQEGFLCLSYKKRKINLEQPIGLLLRHQGKYYKEACI